MSSGLQAKAVHSRIQIRPAEQTKSRIFVAITVPEAAANVLSKSLEYYAPHLSSTIPRKKWHITVAFLGEVTNVSQVLKNLTKPISAAFTPVVSTTHIAAGKAPNSLWAYGIQRGPLFEIRGELVSRLKKSDVILLEEKEFTPHISLGMIKKNTTVLESPCSLSFPVHNLEILQSITDNNSTKYVSLGSISITP